MTEHRIFSDWLAARGGYVNPDLCLFNDFPNGSRGIAAKSNIKEGDPLLLVPMKDCIHMSARADEQATDTYKELCQFIGELPESIVPFLRTTLMLMHHLSMGKDTPMASYLATLPASHDCTLCWDDSDMAPLRGTSVQHTGRRMSEEVFSDHIAPALKQRPHLWPGSDYACFEYAAGMVQSRSFHMNEENFITGESVEGKELYLIPGVDMLNHSTRPERVNTALQHRKEEAAKQGSGSDADVSFTGFFAIDADRPIRAGEEVTISYGNLSDAQLLQTYGFVEEHEGFTNPWNSVVVPSDAVVQAAAVLRKSADKGRQKRRRQEEKEEVTFKITEAEPLPDALLDSVEELAEEDEAVPVLLTLADKLLAAYEGSQQADEEALKSRSARGRLLSALLVRVGERRLIRRFKQAVILGLAAGSEEEGEDDEYDPEEGDEDEDEESDAE